MTAQLHHLPSAALPATVTVGVYREVTRPLVRVDAEWLYVAAADGRVQRFSAATGMAADSAAGDGVRLHVVPASVRAVAVAVACGAVAPATGGDDDGR